jgi:hypothetical protein
MLGIINQALEAYLITKYGTDLWADIVARCPGVQTNWVSSCPYSDPAFYQ